MDQGCLEACSETYILCTINWFLHVQQRLLARAKGKVDAG